VKYNIIYADPPWNYKDQGCSGTMANHYKGMNIDDICNLNVNDICEKDCILFMWVTYPMLKEGLKVIDRWGFEYKTIAFQWIKTNKKGLGYFFGLGRWTRGNTECCLLATKGKPKRLNNSISQLIIAPVTKHSEKPIEARQKIVSLVGNLKRIELFARKKTNGWDSWGNEIDNNVDIQIKNGKRRVIRYERCR